MINECYYWSSVTVSDYSPVFGEMWDLISLLDWVVVFPYFRRF